jgi:histidyl-tRNA synthetase
MKAQMKLANRSGARFAVIVGEDEQANHAVTVRPMRGGEQFSIPRTELVDRLKHEASR